MAKRAPAVGALRRPGAVAVAAALSLAAPAGAQAALVIKASPGGVVSLGGFHPAKDPSLAAAKRRFGAPSRLTRIDATACRARWARLALTIVFANFGAPGACLPNAMVAQAVRIQGRAAKRWRTTRGLRAGDAQRRIGHLYRTSRRHGASYWLVWFYQALGASPGYSPRLEALVRHDRVYAFRLWVGAAGD